MNLKTLILGVIVVIILVILYYWFFSDNEQTTLVSLKDATIAENVDANNVPKSADFTYSLWVFIKDYNYNYGQEKFILMLPNADNFAASNEFSFQLYLDNFQSDLICKIRDSVGTAISHTTCKVESIPLQRWTHILVSHRNKALDMYIDGKLVKTCTLSGPYLMPSGTTAPKLLVCPTAAVAKKSAASTAPNTGPGFRGFLGNMRYYTRAIQPREAYQIYKEGYTGGNWLSDMFNKYKLKIAFLEDQKELSSLVL